MLGRWGDEEKLLHRFFRTGIQFFGGELRLCLFELGRAWFDAGGFGNLFVGDFEGSRQIFLDVVFDSVLHDPFG